MIEKKKRKALNKYELCFYKLPNFSRFSQGRIEVKPGLL